MKVQANARLTPLGRQLLCERVRLLCWSVEEAAFAANVSERTFYRWLARYDAGEPLTDRSSRPHRSPMKTSKRREAMIEQTPLTLEGRPRGMRGPRHSTL